MHATATITITHKTKKKTITTNSHLVKLLIDNKLTVWKRMRSQSVQFHLLTTAHQAAGTY